jgi:hypothetical protein
MWSTKEYYESPLTEHSHSVILVSQEFADAIKYKFFKGLKLYLSVFLYRTHWFREKHYNV